LHNEFHLNIFDSNLLQPGNILFHFPLEERGEMSEKALEDMTKEIKEEILSGLQESQNKAELLFQVCISLCQAFAYQPYQNTLCLFSKQSYLKSTLEERGEMSEKALEDMTKEIKEEILSGLQESLHRINLPILHSVRLLM